MKTNTKPQFLSLVNVLPLMYIPLISPPVAGDIPILYSHYCIFPL